MTLQTGHGSVLVRTSRPYPVHVGPGVLALVADELEPYVGDALLTDDTVGPLYRSQLGLDDIPTLSVAPGEEAKDLRGLERVSDFLADAELDRRACLVTLGGGVVGDLGGLAASLYMRGIGVVHCPTTLLAQVDASVGGKTAVNLRAGKNLVGTFHQPSAVFADTSVLATLSADELRSGLGEVVKSALLSGAEFLTFVEEQAASIVARDPEVLGEVVLRCVRFKAATVASDEREGGPRKLLNLGHTFAHAIEHAAGYGRVPHGIAVGVGLTLSLEASRQLGLLEDVRLPERVSGLLEALGLEHSLAELERTRSLSLSVEALVEGMRHDKKGGASAPRLVLLRAAGSAEFDVEPGPAVVEATLGHGTR